MYYLLWLWYGTCTVYIPHPFVPLWNRTTGPSNIVGNDRSAYIERVNAEGGDMWTCDTSATVCRVRFVERQTVRRTIVSHIFRILS